MRIEFQASGPVRLRALIAHLVRWEVAAFVDRQLGRRFVRVLMSADLERQVAAGKVDSGDRRAGPAPDSDTAVLAAWQAFDDGLFVVFINDQEVSTLHQLVTVDSDTRVRFLRLVPLVGG